MILALNSAYERPLYAFFTDKLGHIPFYFPTDFHTWRESLLRDTDYSGEPLFKETKTFLLLEGEAIAGFMQLAMTDFVFAPDGTKSKESGYGLIRNLYFLPDCQKGHLLMACAADYFKYHGVAKPYAFFHYFGMSCYARQGKLHETAYHVEKLLMEYGYAKEHENVYFNRLLTDDFDDDREIVFEYGGDDASISFRREGRVLGGCKLYFVPNSSICFLRWIWINPELTHQGYGTRCMKKLFFVLKQKGISRLDTDTADSNLGAQGYYRKTGFADMGRMRSYCID